MKKITDPQQRTGLPDLSATKKEYLLVYAISLENWNKLSALGPLYWLVRFFSSTFTPAGGGILKPFYSLPNVCTVVHCTVYTVAKNIELIWMVFKSEGSEHFSNILQHILCTPTRRQNNIYNIFLVLVLQIY